jgi:hypothetical protein
VSKFPGDKASLDILRDGREMRLDIPLIMPRPAVSQCEYDVMPSYYIFGGLVFTPLTRNYIETFDQWWYYAPLELRYHMDNDVAKPDHEQTVVLQYVLADEANVGYHDMRNLFVASVNGDKVRDLADLVSKVESSGNYFVSIEFDNGDRIVLSREAALAANGRIQERYGIPSDRSQDLR